MNALGVVHVSAIVVTYHPDLNVLRQLLVRLEHQVQSTVIVDNGSGLELASWLQSIGLPSVGLIALERNFGIAKAQNVGIDWAKVRGSSHVLLMDQDSLPGPGMVAELLSVALERTAKSAVSEGRPLAAVGPCYLDVRQENPPPFIRVRGLSLERLTRADGPVVPVDYLIASGCLIPMDVIEAVGPMREDLFIDYVDIEWGLRAAQKGFGSHGVFAATMEHTLGEAPKRILGRNVPVHTPLRHYYHLRNAVLLYREAWVPLNWKLVDAWRMLLKFGYYSLFTAPRLQHAQMMLLGLWHGLRGRAGPLHTL